MEHIKIKHNIYSKINGDRVNIIRSEIKKHEHRLCKQ